MSEMPVYTPEPLVSEQPVKDRSGLAIASLVVGIVNLCAWILPICGGPIAIAGLILGILSRKSTKRGMAIAGIILAVVTLILTIVALILGIAFAPQIMQNLDLQQFMY